MAQEHPRVTVESEEGPSSETHLRTNVPGCGGVTARGPGPEWVCLGPAGSV